jgi:predicted NBD/HSP70 family sugar kinase
MLKISGAGEAGSVKFNADNKKVLGVGFKDGETILVVMDLAGRVVDKEDIKVAGFKKWKGRNKEVEGLVDQIGQESKFKGGEYFCVGIAIPAEMISINQKSSEILAKGIKSLFKCAVYVSKESTAAAYAERDFTKKPIGETLIYMHGDIGIGTVIKNEMVFETDGYVKGEDKAYLSPWNQFSVTRTAKRLIDKGVGTDIVKMVNGNPDDIDTEIILKAAENKDEFAEDLVKRSGLALGVRVAYLANLFNADAVILGGGVEIKEGSFIKYIQESSNKFVMKNIAGKLKIIPGVLGKEASSTGAAALCRRELFMMEV